MQRDRLLSALPGGSGDGAALLPKLDLGVSGGSHIGTSDQNTIDRRNLEAHGSLSPIFCEELAILLAKVWDRGLVGSRKSLTRAAHFASPDLPGEESRRSARFEGSSIEDSFDAFVAWSRGTQIGE